MNGQQFKVVRGVVSDLRVQQDEEDFVFSSGDKAAGGVAATGLALDRELNTSLQFVVLAFIALLLRRH